MRQAMLCVAAVILIGFAVAPIQAQDSEITRKSLRDISGMSVNVESLSDEAKELGLSVETIRTDVELKLRLAGIRVVTDDEDLNLPGMPTLYVNITVPNGTRAVSMSVQLQQNALLERNNQRAVDVTTWDVGAVGVNLTAQDIRDKIKDMVDRFLNAWLSVNPKK